MNELWYRDQFAFMEYMGDKQAVSENQKRIFTRSLANSSYEMDLLPPVYSFSPRAKAAAGGALSEGMLTWLGLAMGPKFRVFAARVAEGEGEVGFLARPVDAARSRAPIHECPALLVQRK